MSTQKIEILIVDDHPMVREGLSLRINRELDLNVCCEANSVESALSACEQYRPDLALIDLRLENSSGLILVKQLKNRFPTLIILVISMHDENIFAERAIKAGASGYIMKQEAMDTLVQAIRLVLKGHLYVSDALRTQLVRQHLQQNTENAAVSRLSTAEFDVLNLVGMRLSNREIAQKLSRSTKTIETHCANIRKKLGLGNSKDLVRYAIDYFKAENELSSL